MSLDDGGSKHLRNVGLHLRDYAELHSRRLLSSSLRTDVIEDYTCHCAKITNIVISQHDIVAMQQNVNICLYVVSTHNVIENKKSKAVPLHAMEALGGRGGVAPTHSRPRH
jgi:hypothetical protein